MASARRGGPKATSIHRPLPRLVWVALAAGLASSAEAQDARAPAATSIGQALSDAAPSRSGCTRTDPNEVVVCGPSQQHYRIDPSVLAAERAIEAPPPKPKLDATTAQGCAGPNCGGGDYVPLVGMALTALKAAELAADGDDWREAFRTRPDQYRAYQQQKAKQPKPGGISIGLTVGNK